MEISDDLLVKIVIGVVSALLGGFIAFMGVRVTLEARLKNLEKEIEFLEPVKKVVQILGSEKVEQVFRMRERE